MLEIFTLGTLEIRLDGAPLPELASRKAEALLVYLVCNPRPHSREVLATFFWDDRPQSRALGNLSVLLTSLRKHLAPYLHITRYTVAFDPQSPYRLDAEQLERTFQEVLGREEAEEQLTPEAASRLEEALSLARGRFLEGFYLRESRGFDEWVTLERERIEQHTARPSAGRSLITCGGKTSSWCWTTSSN